jgi:hypothetical protein
MYFSILLPFYYIKIHEKDQLMQSEDLYWYQKVGTSPTFGRCKNKLCERVLGTGQDFIYIKMAAYL